MATYYSSPSNQREPAPILYPREHIPTSYPEASVLSSNMMIYMSSEPYTEAAALAASSQQQSNCLEIPPIGPASDSASQQHDILSSLGGFSESPSIVHGVQGQGLSLSLGTTFRGPNNMGFASFHDHHHPRGVEYLGFGDQDSSKPDFPPYGVPGGVSRVVPGSKYLKAAQQLLDEVVNVEKALRQSDAGEKGGQEKRTARSPNKDGDDGSKSESTLGGGGDSSAGNSQQPELSHTEKQDLQNKLTKLLSMLDEVDRRYKQYYHQMQIVVSSFDAIAGGGSAKPYTVLALQTISRHFRCLRDAITGQIKATRKSLGEDDTSGNAKGVGISRLRYVDQQLRQQRALQQLGMMQQHTWRPQRGLPESSVLILRAWLFEHFLHPYPKDSDKIMLARQTSLTRSQVSNWFINARVRLWKPMVEEMYKEETGDADMDSNSSSENAARASKAGGGGGDDDRPEDSSQHHRQSASSTGPFVDPAKPNHVPQPDVEMAGGPDYGSLMMMKPPPPPQRREDLYPGPAGFHHETGGGGERFAVAAAASYHMSEMGRYGGGAAGGSGVSLTLGLQHCDGGPGGPHHHGFVGMRGHGDMYNGGAGGGAPTVGPEGLDFEQPRFAAAVASSSHLLHDFVV